jgi:HPt (histidine-containing phosphotransfer) domain-containing protein
MSVILPAQRARAILLTALPDLVRRETAYRVTWAAPDPELVDALVEHLRETRPGLRAAADARDFARIASVAHGLKGMGGSVGLPEISAAGAVLEEAAQSGNPAETMQVLAALDAWVAAYGGAE